MTQNKGAHVFGVQEGLVKIYSDQENKNNPAFVKNEVIYIIPSSKKQQRQERIMCEILRINGNIAEAQIFEPASGIGIGDPVEQSGLQLSATLGPGLLGKIFDGLQLPLVDVASEHGFFLPRGVTCNVLDENIEYNFKPNVTAGDKVRPGDVLGFVMEGRFEHKIMVPFYLSGEFTITDLYKGSATLHKQIALLKDSEGKEHVISLVQKWPVRNSIPQKLIKENLNERLFPSEPMITTTRMIDTLFPIARGGTACIPGPFGAGKTVLQSLLAKYAAVDIVIVVACGERAGEVVETIHDFPEMKDPTTGGSLMDRTIIICNTSSMPVAAREASIYTGLTLAEYYRQMGYNVLLIADSTSRWAQAMRETAGRMEEIPGEEGFPAYLDSAIRNVYERAGIIKTNDGSVGSVTMIGTVSPAGGNFEEPVTQATLGTVKGFLGLSYARAYKRFYPAIDPMISWSRYSDQLRDWFRENVDIEWDRKVRELHELLIKGNKIDQMMQVTGEEGVSLEDYTTFNKARFADMVFLQQDAFDDVDASCPIERQEEMLNLLHLITNKHFTEEAKEGVHELFAKLTAKCKNLNYLPFKGKKYQQLLKDIQHMIRIS